MELRKIILSLSFIGFLSLSMGLIYGAGIFHNAIGLLLCLLLINIAISWRYDYSLFGGRLLLVIFGGINILLVGSINALDLINIGVINDIRMLFSIISLLVGYGIMMFSLIYGDARFGQYLLIKSFVGDKVGRILFYLSWVLIFILVFIIFGKME